jgi:hypothetical protein
VCNPKTTTLLKLAQQHDPKCKKILTDIPPWTKMAIDLNGKLTVISSTCAKDKRKENTKKHNIKVKTHINDQSILTIYTDGSKTKDGTGARIITYHKGLGLNMGMGKPAVSWSRVTRVRVRSRNFTPTTTL